jgi:predicted transcriptional regulator
VSVVPLPTRPKRDASLTIRVAPAAVEALDVLAEQEQRTRSDMARILLSEALAARQRKDRR